MWDYGAFPVWSVPDGSGWQGSLTDLEIPETLRRDLQAWSDEWTAAVWGDHGPDHPKWRPPPDEVRQAWIARGQGLTQELRAVLGPDYEIVLVDCDEGDQQGDAR